MSDDAAFRILSSRKFDARDLTSAAQREMRRGNRMQAFARQHRDEAYIRDLAAAVDRFNDELAEIVEKVRRYGAPSPLEDDLKSSLLVPDNILMAG